MDVLHLVYLFLSFLTRPFLLTLQRRKPRGKDGFWGAQGPSHFRSAEQLTWGPSFIAVPLPPCHLNRQGPKGLLSPQDPAPRGWFNPTGLLHWESHASY